MELPFRNIGVDFQVVIHAGRKGRTRTERAPVACSLLLVFFLEFSQLFLQQENTKKACQPFLRNSIPQESSPKPRKMQGIQLIITYEKETQNTWRVSSALVPWYFSLVRLGNSLAPYNFLLRNAVNNWFVHNLGSKAFLCSVFYIGGIPYLHEL